MTTKKKDPYAFTSEEAKREAKEFNSMMIENSKRRAKKAKKK